MAQIDCIFAQQLAFLDYIEQRLAALDNLRHRIDNTNRHLDVAKSLDRFDALIAEYNRRVGGEAEGAQGDKAKGDKAEGDKAEGDKAEGEKAEGIRLQGGGGIARGAEAEGVEGVEGVETPGVQPAPEFNADAVLEEYRQALNELEAAFPELDRDEIEEMAENPHMLSEDGFDPQQRKAIVRIIVARRNLLAAEAEIDRKEAPEESAPETPETPETPESDTDTAPETTENPDSKAEDASTEAESVQFVQQAPEQPAPSALSRIPVNSKTKEPIFEQAPDSETGWDGLVEMAGSTAAAAEIAQAQIDALTAELKKLKSKSIKLKGTPMQMRQQQQQHKDKINTTQKHLDAWSDMLKVYNQRVAMERQRAEEQRASVNAAKGASGVLSDWTEESPAESRARGYRMVNGHRVDRQQPIDAVQGGESDVPFTTSERVPCRPSLVELDDTQPSHIDGSKNPEHFINDAQPKDRTGGDSKLGADKIAREISPKEITGTTNAYTGSPVVNTRGEAIQGNGRLAALRKMYEDYPEQAEEYRQYLIENAKWIFNLEESEVEAMRQAIREAKRPVAVNIVDVSDADAMRLGQYAQSNIETGGSGHIEVVNTFNLMRSQLSYFATLLLTSDKKDKSLRELVVDNGREVIKWMAARDYISDTQAQNAFNSKGVLTTEARDTLEELLKYVLYENAPVALPEAFEKLPDSAQKALLAVAFRDLETSAEQKVVPHLHQAILAYALLLEHPQFAAAKDIEVALRAVEGWKTQLFYDTNSGESVLPTKKFSNFALTLAAFFKFKTQASIQDSLNEVFRLMKATADLWNQNPEAKTLEEAVREVFKIELQHSKPKTNKTNETNGTNGGGVLAGDT